MRYIELNPVGASNALGAENDLISFHFLYTKLGRNGPKRQSAYRQLFRAHIPQAELKNIRDCTNKAWVLGSDQFKNRIEKLSERRVKPKPRGRPQKTVD